MSTPARSGWAPYAVMVDGETRPQGSWWMISARYLPYNAGVVGGAPGYEEYEAWPVGIDHCGGPCDIAGCATGSGQQAAPDLRLLGDLGCHGAPG